MAIEWMWELARVRYRLQRRKREGGCGFERAPTRRRIQIKRGKWFREIGFDRNDDEDEVDDYLISLYNVMTKLDS